jgi:WhiB family redox-sensing transcriptional regulator
MTRKKYEVPTDLISDDILDWGKYAACKGKESDMWYPETLGTMQGRQDMRNAKMICSLCIVRAKCLKYADDNNEAYGIWGGLTPQERGYKRFGRTVRHARQVSH